MTPLELKIMLECYSSADPGINMKTSIWNSTAANDARDRLEELGLVDMDSLKATDKGEYFVHEMLCKTPPPISFSGFKDPRFKEKTK